MYILARRYRAMKIPANHRGLTTAQESEAVYIDSSFSRGERPRDLLEGGTFPHVGVSERSQTVLVPRGCVSGNLSFALCHASDTTSSHC